jgi:2-hydroxy-3-oxopropionate reductase
MDEQAIGFIGLGQMGQPMARRLLRHGYQVRSAVNRSRAGIETLAADGIVECATPAEAAAGSQAVITMARDTEETRALVLGEAGLLAAMAPGATLIVMSTVDPGFCRELAAEAAGRDVAALDIPVSGFPFRAAEGTLALMVGGDPAAIERCRPLLEVMGTVLICGGAGMGQVAKLANNAVAAGTFAAVLESRAFAEANGMPGERLLEILASASGDSFVVRKWEAIQPMWAHVMGLVRKDVAIFRESADAGGVAIPLAEVVSRYPWPEQD